MSKKLIIAMAVLSVAFIGSSFAAVENIKVSGDINSEAVTRDLSLDLDGAADHEDFIFSQIRLRFDADLTEGVSAVVRLINERIWGDEDDSASETEIELDLAYVQLQEFLYQPLTLVIGRQELRYGNGLIIGDPDTNQLASGNTPTQINDLSLKKSFDAVRAIFDYAPYTLDVIYAKVDEFADVDSVPTGTNVRDDITIVGTNLAYDWSSYNGITEVYGFWTEDRTNTQIVEDHEDRTITLGGRTQFDPNDKLTLGLEGALQLGDSYADNTSRDREAFAVQAMAEYKLLDEKNSKVGVSYTYLSGDDDSGDSEDNAWDSLFEDQSPAEIINILQANTNAQYISANVSTMPREDLTLGLLYTHARLARKYTSSTLTDGKDNDFSVATNKKHFGDEIDIYGIYDYTEDVQLKVNGAIFMPGDVFESSNDATAYSIRGGVNVDF